MRWIESSEDSYFTQHHISSHLSAIHVPVDHPLACMQYISLVCLSDGASPAPRPLTPRGDGLKPRTLLSRHLGLPLSIGLARVLTACHDDIDRVLIFTREISTDDFPRTVGVAFLCVEGRAGVCRSVLIDGKNSQ